MLYIGSYIQRFHGPIENPQHAVPDAFNEFLVDAIPEFLFAYFLEESIRRGSLLVLEDLYPVLDDSIVIFIIVLISIILPRVVLLPASALNHPIVAAIHDLFPLA